MKMLNLIERIIGNPITSKLALIPLAGIVAVLVKKYFGFELDTDTIIVILLSVITIGLGIAKDPTFKGIASQDYESLIKEIREAILAQVETPGKTVETSGEETGGVVGTPSSITLDQAVDNIIGRPKGE